MDSKVKAGLGVPAAGTPEIRLEEQRARRTNRGLVITVVVLAVAVVGLGVALIAATQKEEGGLLSGNQEWLIREFTAAVNRSDGDHAAAVFAEDGIFRLPDGQVYEGRTAIEAYVGGLPPMGYRQVGELTGDASRATGTFSYASEQGSGTLTREFTFVGSEIASVTDSEGTAAGGAGTVGTVAAGAAEDHAAAIEGLLTALNAGDVRAAAEYYAEDTLFTYWGGELVGRDAVAGFFKNVVVPNGWNLQVLAPMIGYGDVVAAVVYVEDESGALMTYLDVYTFDTAGQIHDQIGMQEMEM